jgi:CHRD domain
MRIRLVLLVMGLVAALALAGVAVAADSGRPFSTAMTGAAEVPGPGDPDARGQADITLNQGLGEVCFDLTWQGIDGTVTAAHIHVGAATVAGPVVVPLFAGTFAGTDSASGCVAGVSEELVKAIRQDPSNYYVNVHSDVFPAGAIRGQLAK